MTRTRRWLLCDYGQVLCSGPPADEWVELAVTAGYPAADAPDPGHGRFHDIYWRHRPGYDRGDVSALEFWSAVASRPLDEASVAELIRRDTAIWLHEWPESIAAATGAAERLGYQLAIFSNAPVEVSAGIDALPGLAPFERRFYSCFLRSTKPDPQAYRAVLRGLDAEPADVVFVDDRRVNVEAARRLGIEAHLFSGPAQFDRLG